MLILSYDSPNGGHPEVLASIPSAIKKGIYFEFSGGLGDVINGVVTTDVFRKLDALKPGDRAVIVLFCHNPDAPDLFLYHHLSAQFVILSLGFHDCFDQVYRRRHGLPPKPFFHHPVLDPVPYKPRFSESDRAVLNTFPEKFVAFSVTASNGKGEGRSIPSHIYTSVASVCLKRGLTPIFLGKRYTNVILDDHKPSTAHNEADPPKLDGVLSAIDRFSVSGSLETVRRSVATVVCNSAIMHASWRMRRPTFFVATNHEWDDYKKCKRLDLHGYGYGLAYPENKYCSHGNYTESQFSGFLDLTLNGGGAK
jgi:hypothetical protein